MAEDVEGRRKGGAGTSAVEEEDEDPNAGISRFVVGKGPVIMFVGSDVRALPFCSWEYEGGKGREVSGRERACAAGSVDDRLAESAVD